MTQFTISGQSHIIDDVLEHLKYGSAGFSICHNWNYEIISSEKIIFSLKEGKEVKPADLFWFGYFTKD
ncbi:hypothetical protein OMO38_10380 [Chryseobacterium sp. 09-1422]|uniref:Uncharacterized protein n=1 Tax=Chryseobacterium kimseyorum TaxID=2984028 RepID=A0ABT3HYQ3_9FLAO|nr:hypothetical protein [Chryseobacterium kimseyorum]MCW3168928.1 hypothetical protein [Chryseobacterium kimseyorum]